eukprot:864681-Amphidinium_carterae.1
MSALPDKVRCLPASLLTRAYACRGFAHALSTSAHCSRCHDLLQFLKRYFVCRALQLTSSSSASTMWSRCESKYSL